MTLLAVTKLGHRYGSQWVFQDLSFEVFKGEALAVLGPNGAGKSTLLRIISGDLKQTAGHISFLGRPLTGPLHKRVQAGLGFLPQNSYGFWNMTVLDNLKIAAYAAGSKASHVMNVLKMVGLEGKGDLKAGELSGGEKRRMEIGRCLTVSPDLLLLDEPFSALDPRSIEMVMGILQNVVSQGVSVVFGDHAVAASLRLSSRAIIIDKGEIIASGTPELVSQNALVKQRYLGDTFKI